MPKLFLSFILSMATIFAINPLEATTYTIKAYSSWGFQGTTYGNALLNTANFGPSGVVKDVQFTIQDVSSITAQMLSDTDIFVAMFPYGTPWGVTSTEAQLLKNFVDGGGSLIVSSDASTNYASTIGAYWGVGLVNGWASTGGSSSIINHTVAPGFTDGPFGVASSLSWWSNATSQVSTPGSSTLIDSFGMVSVIAPTATAGSVVFYGDTDIFTGYSYYGADWPKLALNLFAYSAHSTHTNVPEPSTFALFAVAVVVSILRKKMR